jgi:hypothetical protein
MTNSYAAEKSERWSRPQLDRDHPVRTAGGLYRTADDHKSGIAGVPLIVAEDAVVAAVRMAYKVAQTQVDRSTRLARRLREAGDRAVGARSDRRAIDATELLVSRAMTSALTWLEGLAAEDDSPIKVLARKQFQTVGEILGLAEERGSSSAATPEGAARHETAASPLDPVESKSYMSSRAVKIVLKGGGRPVRVCRLETTAGAPLDPIEIHFYSVSPTDPEPLPARFAIDAAGHATLTFSLQRPAVPGHWRAAICDPKTEEQVGLIEIEL